MKRLTLIIIALLLVPVLAFGEGYPGRGAPNYSLRCWPTNGVVADQSFSNSQVIDTAAEGCTEGSFTVDYVSAGLLASVSNKLRITGKVGTFNGAGFQKNNAIAATGNYGFFSTLSIKPSSFEIGAESVFDVNDDLTAYIRNKISVQTFTSASEAYKIACLFSSSGASFFMKSASSYPNWTLVWMDSGTGNIYPAMYNKYTSENVDVSDIIIPNIDFSSILQPTHLSTFGSNGELSAYTPDVGSTWTETSGDWDTASGKLVATALGIATFEAGTSTAIYDATITTPASGTTNGGMIARYVDGTHFWYLALDDTNNKMKLYECDDDACVAGDEGDLRIDDDKTMAANTAYKVRLIVSATSPYWSVFVDGGTEGTYTTAGTSATATKFGLRDEGNANIVGFDVVGLWPRTSNEVDNAFAQIGY